MENLGSGHLDSDALFGVKDSLVLNFKLNDSYSASKAPGFESSFYDVEYDFILKKVN